MYFFEGPPFKFKCSNQSVHSNFVNCVAYSPDGNLFATVASDKKIVLYDGKTADVLGEMSTSDGHKGSVYSVCFSPDSKQILTSSSDKTCKVDICAYTSFCFNHTHKVHVILLSRFGMWNPRRAFLP